MQMNNYRFSNLSYDYNLLLNLPEVKGDQELSKEYEFANYSSRVVYAKKWDNVNLQPILNCWSHHRTSHKAPYSYYSGLPCKQEQQITLKCTLILLSKKEKAQKNGIHSICAKDGVRSLSVTYLLSWNKSSISQEKLDPIFLKESEIQTYLYI